MTVFCHAEISDKSEKDEMMNVKKHDFEINIVKMVFRNVSIHKQCGWKLNSTYLSFQRRDEHELIENGD